MSTSQEAILVPKKRHVVGSFSCPLAPMLLSIPSPLALPRIGWDQGQGHVLSPKWQRPILLIWDSILLLSLPTWHGQVADGWYPQSPSERAAEGSLD